MNRLKFGGWIFALFLLLLTFACTVTKADPYEDTLVRQANYICDCSFTEMATHHEGVPKDADGYGVINDVRIVDRRPDWVNESCDAAMGLMAAAEQLQRNGRNIDRYNRVLQAQFEVWLLQRRQPFDTDPASPDFSGATSDLTYDPSGHLTKKSPASSGATGVVVCAMWKYFEYLRDTGQTRQAAEWLTAASPLAEKGGEMLTRNINRTYGLVGTGSNNHDLWIANSVYAADALQCLAAWAPAVHKGGGDRDGKSAEEIRAGIERMRDDGGGKPNGWKNFFKFRGASDFTKPQYGDSIDQLCFAPYEFDALNPGEPFAKQISDWWTNGSYGVVMTPNHNRPSNWRYYGVHWHYYFDKRQENDYLYPGPSLQLAAVEWKYAKATGDATLLDRARKRYAWVVTASKSGLDYKSSTPDGGVNGGIVDWRDSNNHDHTAPDWQRFSDTSAYCIYCTLMIGYDRDWKFVPQP